MHQDVNDKRSEMKKEEDGFMVLSLVVSQLDTSTPWARKKVCI